jgi:hypothetical protein
MQHASCFVYNAALDAAMIFVWVRIIYTLCVERAAFVCQASLQSGRETGLPVVVFFKVPVHVLHWWPCPDFRHDKRRVLSVGDRVK